MISKLSKWIWIGGILLTISAGMVNSIAYLGYSHQAVTHLTGTTTRASIALIKVDFKLLQHLGLLIISFLFGAILCGIIIKDGELKFGKRYGVALLIESGLLYWAMRSFDIGSQWYGEFFSSSACGLQNAMVATYSGSIIRTTHVTGIITDLGVILGKVIRGLPFDRLTFELYILLLLGFFLGGGVGAYAYDFFKYHALVIPAIITGLLGVFYLVLKLLLATNVNQC